MEPLQQIAAFAIMTAFCWFAFDLKSTQIIFRNPEIKNFFLERKDLFNERQILRKATIRLMCQRGKKKSFDT